MTVIIKAHLQFRYDSIRSMGSKPYSLSFEFPVRSSNNVFCLRERTPDRVKAVAVRPIGRTNEDAQRVLDQIIDDHDIFDSLHQQNINKLLLVIDDRRVFLTQLKYESNQTTEIIMNFGSSQNLVYSTKV